MSASVFFIFLFSVSLQVVTTYHLEKQYIVLISQLETQFNMKSLQEAYIVRL